MTPLPNRHLRQRDFTVYGVAVLITKFRALRWKRGIPLTKSTSNQMTMYFEGLILEIHANKAGWDTIKPPRCKGASGAVHDFAFLAKDDTCHYGFDIYQGVTQEEVLRTYMKKLDTRVLAVVINMSGRPRKEVGALADELGITILGPADIDTFFSINGVEKSGQGAGVEVPV